MSCCFWAVFDVRDGTLDVRWEDVRDTGRTDVDFCDEVTDSFEVDWFDFGKEWTELLFAWLSPDTFDVESSSPGADSSLVTEETDFLEARDSADLATDFTETEVFDCTGEAVDLTAADFTDPADFTDAADLTDAADFTDATDLEDFADLEVKDVTDLTIDLTDNPDFEDFADLAEIWLVADLTCSGIFSVDSLTSGDPVLGETVSGISSAPCWSSMISGTSGDSGSTGSSFADDRDTDDFTDFADLTDVSEVFIDALLVLAVLRVEDFTEFDDFLDSTDFAVPDDFAEMTDFSDFTDFSDKTDFSDILGEAIDAADATDFFSDATDLFDFTAGTSTDVSDFFEVSSVTSVTTSMVTSWPSSSSRSIVVSRNLNDRTELALDSAGVGGWANTVNDGGLVEKRAYSCSKS